MQHLKRVSFWLSCVCVFALVFSLALVSSGALTTSQKSAAPTSASTSVKAYGAVGNKTVNDYQAVYQAIQTASGGNGGSVYFPAGEYLINSSITVPINVELVFAPNSSIFLGSGVTLTLNGSVVAGDQCIFWGYGTVTGAPQNAAANPMWFGANGDDDVDDTAAFQKALTMFNELEVPNTSKGFVLNNLSSPREQIYIHGRDGQKAKIVAAAGSTALFNVTKNNATITHLSLDLSKQTASNATAILINNDVHFVNVTDIDATGAVCFARDPLTEEFKISNVHFSNLNLTGGRGSAIRTKGMYGFIFIEDSTIDYSTSAVTMTFPALDITANQGMLIDNVTIKGQGASGADAHGIKGSSCEAMWFQNCNISNLGGSGIYLGKSDGTRNTYYYINNNTISACANGIEIADGREAQIHENTIISVRNAGIMLNGSRIQVSNNRIESSRNGIESYASSSVFTENTTVNNASYGIYSTGSGCVCANHASANNPSGDSFSGTAVQYALPTLN